MLKGITFVDFLAKVRTGDRLATARFVSDFEPEIARAVGAPLRRLGLIRLYDPMDICQIVLGQFLLDYARGRFKLATSEDVTKLLATLARHRLAERRTHTVEINDVAYAKTDPSAALEQKDLLDNVRKRLTADEWCLASARATGQSWKRIAALRGARADALRMRLVRAGHRIRHSLALDEE